MISTVFSPPFCRDPFWDSNVTWYTEDPDFTECFRNTVLTWTPCFVLWLALPFQYIFNHRSRFRIRRWTWVSITKTAFCVLLALLSLAELFVLIHIWRVGDRLSVPDSAIIAPVVRTGTFLLASWYIHLERKNARPSSALLFLFWLLVTLSSVVSFRSNLRNPYPTGYADRVGFIMQMMYFPITLIQLVLSCCAEKFPELSNGAKNPCPETSSSFPNRATFWWITRLIYTGWRRPLTRADLWQLQPGDKTQHCAVVLQKYWDSELRKRERKPASITSFTSLLSNDAVQPPKPSLTTALLRTFWKALLGAAVLRLGNDMFVFIAPSLLKLLIRFVSDPSEESWKGYLYATAMFLGSLIQVFTLAHYFVMSQRTGMHIRSAVVAQIYAKALKMSASAKRTSTVGEIVNLMAVDSQRFMDLMTQIQLLWSAPLQITIGLFLLWQEMGIATLAGLVTMILLIPFNGFIASRTKTLQISQMKEKDGRIKLMNEILSGMKILKLYAWEESFEKNVLSIRERELATLRKAAYLNSVSSFIMQISPFIVALMTFVTFVLVDENNVLDAEKAFVSLTLFNVLRRPLAFLPDVITAVVQAKVSVGRVTKFLLNDELDLGSIRELPPSDRRAVLVSGASFSWDKETPVLTDINMSILEGSLVAIVGQVGAGKSSLCAAMLGLTDRLGGEVALKGKIAYVTQQAWIQNMSLKDNILFGLPFDRKRYDKVIEACALRKDLDMLPAGDMTEIGEKGINLSGGQKQRVSLARAVYSGADVYFLDDPLSACDAHVGKHIFNNVIGSTGLLAGKTRILVTHGIGYLPKTDQIVVLANGRISETGTYKELLHDSGAFADFLRTYLSEPHEDEGETDIEGELVKNEILEELGPQKIIQRSASIVSNSSAKVRRVLRQESKTANEYKPKVSETTIDGAANLVHPVPSKTSSTRGALMGMEKAELGEVKFSVYVMFLRQMTWSVVAGIFTFYILSNAASLGTNIWLGEWADDSADPVKRNDTTLRDYRLGVYGALGALQGIFILLSALVLASGQVFASRKQHEGMLKRIMRAPMAWFDTTPLGRVVNRFSKDVDYVDSVIPTNFRMWLNCFFQVVATVVVICYTTPAFTVVVFPLGLLYYVIQRFFIPTSRQLKRLESVSRSPIYSHFAESINGANVIVAQRQIDRFLAENERLMDFSLTSYFPSIVAQRWLAVRVEFIGLCAVFFAGLFAVIGRDRDWGINPKDIGLSISYALNVTQILNMMVRVASELEANIVSVERIKEYTEIAQEADWVIEDKRPETSWPQEGHIVFRHYQTRYRPELDLVLTNVDCTVESGEKVGIVGRTGAGKSSLTLALFRIIEPAGGAIVIDGLNITDMGLHDLRSRLTIIPQEPVLFSGTLRMNLDPFDSYSDDDLWRALESSHLKRFVSALPDGLSHMIAEGGENLSVGQRQLVCLARALLRKTKVLVLDEATAAVDLETDALIQNTIRDKFKDCTVITIAHRLNTIMDSTRVMVLDGGAVKEFAPPMELLADKSSIFYSLAKSANISADTRL